MFPALLVVVCWVVVVPVTGSVLVVVVVVCASANSSDAAQTKPAANILVNLICFIILPLLSFNGCSRSYIFPVH
jgi:hypothetical protein